jgi:hypothetical protein
MTLTLQELCRFMDIDTLSGGVCDAPYPAAFAPPVSLKRRIFDHYSDDRHAAIHWTSLNIPEPARDADIGS